MPSSDDSDDGPVPCKRRRFSSSLIHSESESSDDPRSDNDDDDTEDSADILMDKPSSSSRPIDSTSEDEASDDSEESESDSEDQEGSIAVCPSEDESDVERYDDDKASAIQQEKVKDQDSSSGSDEDSESCPICLSKLSSSKLPSKPDSGCNHMFCRECIIEWSKQVNTCPIDRQPFKVIIVYNRIGGNEIAREKCKQKVSNETAAAVEDVPEEVILCERCGCGDRGDVLLLCDGCDLGYHMDCLVPSLCRIPRGRWFCPTCEASGLISDYLTQRPTWRSIEDTLPRTMENIRIRATIQRTINQVSALVGSVVRPSTTRKRKRKTATKRKKKSPTKKKSTKTKRKSTSSSKKKTSTKKRKSTKRKTKKKQKKAKQGKNQLPIGNGNNEAIPDFQLFGNQNDLMFYGDDQDLYASNEMPSTSGSSSTINVLSKSEAVKILKASKDKKPVAKVKPILRQEEETPTNLLGQILSRQNEFLKVKDPSESIIAKREDSSEEDNKPKKKTDNPALIKCSQKPSCSRDSDSKSAEKRVTDSKSAEKRAISRENSKPSTSASSAKKPIDSKSDGLKRIVDLKSLAKRESKLSNPTESSTSSGSAQQREYLSKEKKQVLMTKAEEKVKTFLKPFFARGIIDKDAYKMIMRKCVEKVYERSKLTPVLDEKIAKLVKEYVERLK